MSHGWITSKRGSGTEIDATDWIGCALPQASTWILSRSEGEALLRPPRLLTGEEAQALLGLAPGPALGRALEDLRQAQVDGRVRSREEAIGFLGERRPRAS